MTDLEIDFMYANLFGLTDAECDELLDRVEVTR